MLSKEVEIELDIGVLLSAVTIPNSDNKRISEMLKVPLTNNGSFPEAYMKLRPVDF